MTIILRNSKGSPLTFSEMDGNFTDLDARIDAIVDGEYDQRVFNPSTGIELDNNVIYARYTQTGSVSFTLGPNPRNGSIAVLSFISNGTAPTFPSNFRPWGWQNGNFSVHTWKVGAYYTLLFKYLANVESGIVLVMTAPFQEPEIADESISNGKIKDGVIQPAKLVTQGSVTPGAYSSADVTVNAQGLITAIATGSGGSGLLTSVVLSASRDAATTDAGPNKVVVSDSASNFVLTLQPNATIDIPRYSVINVARRGSGTLTFSAGSGVTILPDSMTPLPEQFDKGTLHHDPLNTWTFYGDRA